MKYALLLTLALAVALGLSACGGGGGGPAPVTLTPPTQTAPTSGTTVPIPVTLTWTAVTGATSYLVETGQESDLSLGVNTTAAGASVKFDNLPQGTTLYWRVAAKAGSTLGPWSPIWSFTPKSGAPPPPVVNPPSLVSPTDGASLVAPTAAAPLTFSWTAVAQATGYTFQVATDNPITSSGLLLNVSSAPTSYAVKSLPVGKLYWQVRAQLTSTTSTAWSATGSFTVKAAPPPPQDNHDSALLGTWQAVSATRDGAALGVPGALGFTSGDYQTLQFAVAPVAATRETYHNGSRVSGADGTWTGLNGSGSYTLPSGTTNFTYSLATTNLLDLTMTLAGHTVVTRWVNQAPLAGHDPNLETTWVAVSATRNGQAITPANLFRLRYATNQQTLQFLPSGTQFRRELQDQQEAPIIHHLTSAWSTGAGALSFAPTWYSPQQSGYYTFSAGTLLTTTLDTTYGYTDVVTWNHWAVLSGTLPANLQGTWSPTGVTVNGTPSALAFYLGWHSGTTAETFQFYPDGTLELSELAGATLNWAGLSPWYYLNGALAMSFGGSPATVQYAVSGSTLTLTEPNTLIGTLVYTLTRQS